MEPLHLLEGAGVAGVGLADGVPGAQLVTVHIVLVLHHGSNAVTVERLGTPLAISISVDSLGRPGCEGGGTAGVQGNAGSVVCAPLAVSVSDAPITKVVLGHSLEGAGMSGMGLADGVLGVQLMTVDVVTVLKGGDAVAVGLSGPLAVSVSNATVTKMVLGHSLEGAGMSGMGLADGELGVQLMAIDVVTVFNGGDAVAVGLSDPLANPVSVGPIDGGVSSVSHRGGPG